MATRALTGSRPTAGARFPVLMYHGLLREGQAAEGGEGAARYWLPVTRFTSHLDLIARGGWRIGRLGDTWTAGAPPGDSRPPVVLTFDDGRASDYEVAFPALGVAGAVADFFVNTATVDRPGFLTWAQVAEMQRAGCSFQSHGHDHVALLWLTPRALESQLDRSKRTLEDRIGSAVSFFAVPYGLTNRRVVDTARKVGYQAVCTSLSWPARAGRSPITRIVVQRDTSDSSLTRLLRGEALALAGRVARAAAVYVPKRVLLRLRPGMLGVRVQEVEA